MLRPLEVYLRFKKPNPHLQRHMLFPRLTLIPMAVEDTILWSRYLMKSKSGFIKETFDILKVMKELDKDGNECFLK